MVIDKINDAAVSIMMALTGGITGAGLWVVRRILTNQKQIAIMEAALHARDQQRKEDRLVLTDIQADLKEVRKEVVEARVKLAEIHPGKGK